MSHIIIICGELCLFRSFSKTERIGERRYHMCVKALLSPDNI